MLISRGAEDGGQAGGRHQPAEGVACGGALGHVPRRRLEYMEDAVQIGCKHAAPLLFGAVDEGVSSATADAGVGEASVDPAEPLKRRAHRRFDRCGIADVADDAVELAGRAGHAGERIFVLVGVAPPDGHAAAGRGQGLRDAKTDTAVTPGDDGHPAGEIEDTHERFQSGLARVKPCVRWRQMLLPRPWTSPPRKSNMTPKRTLAPQDGITRATHREETDAVQTRHA